MSTTIIVNVELGKGTHLRIVIPNDGVNGFGEPDMYNERSAISEASVR